MVVDSLQYENAAGVGAFLFPEYFAVTGGSDLLVEEILPGGIGVQHQVMLIRGIADEKTVVLPIMKGEAVVPAGARPLRRGLR